MLSNGEIGKIVFIHNEAPSRPIIQIGTLMKDLLFEPQLKIDSLI